MNEPQGTSRKNPVDEGLLPAPGSDFYYASLYFAAPVRRQICVLEGLRRELTRIPCTCGDRGVAHIKLAWWQDEFDRLGSSSPRHPLTRALAPLLAGDAGLKSVFSPLIEALDRGLREVRLATREDVVDYVIEVQGPVIDAISACAAASQRRPDASARRLAALIELAYDLRGLREHRAGATLHICSAALERHGVGNDDLRHATSSVRFASLLGEELDWLRTTLAETLATMPRVQRRRHRLLTTLARIQNHALKLTLEDDCQVLERCVELTPVHKLWLAWRTHRFG